MALLPNSQFGRYEIRSLLGKGGMGEVYLAHDPQLRRQVAIKLLPAEFAHNPARLGRFEREAYAASSLNHPNILTIHEIGEHDSVQYIATEYIDGESLRQRLSRARMELKEALDVTAQVASALSAAHAAGIVHRDIKPENIMVRRDGYVKVLDFGLAKLADEWAAASRQDEAGHEAPTQTRAVHTEPGLVMGTAGYMSPEQARGLEVDARSDIWSLGVVLYEMVSGRLPFEGATTTDVLSMILHREPPSLLLYRRDVPAEAERIVERALTKEREERYQSAKELSVDVKRLRHRLEMGTQLERSVTPEEEKAWRGSGQSATGGREPAVSGTTPAAAAAPSADANAARTVSSAEYVVETIKRHKRSAALILAAALAATAMVAYAAYSRHVAASGTAIHSIAVLPFVNASSDPNMEYLSDGISESLINALSQLPQLRVIARNSAFKYKGNGVDQEQVAAALDVRTIVTGRVIQRGENLTVSAELVDVRDNKQLWGARYERRSADVLTVQREIAREISANLQLKLSSADERRVTQNYTDNPEAYQLYLKGRFYWNKRTTEGLKQAEDYYKRAIEKDPAFALAYSALAETYVLFPYYSVALPKESLPQAKAAAQRALEIDETIAEAHAALGLYQSNYAWNPAAAEKELRRAIELKPNYPTAHQWLNAPLLAAQRFDEAVATLRRAEELDPLSLIISADTGLALLFTRRFDEARAQCERTLVLDPNFYYARYLLGWAYYGKGMYREAIEQYRKSLELNPVPYAKALLALALAKSGGRAEAIRLRDELVRESTSRYLPGYHLALVNMALGERDAAFASLERDVAERGPVCASFAYDPLLDDLRDDPRFAALMQKMASAKLN